MTMRSIWLATCAVAIAALLAMGIMLQVRIARGAELPIPRKAKVSVTMKREKGPAPVYKPAAEPAPIDRPAGIP